MQVMHVEGGFWISLKFPDTLIEVISFQYRGIMDGGIHFAQSIEEEGRRAELGYLRRYAAQYQKSLQFIREVKSPENAEGFSYR